MRTCAPSPELPPEISIVIPCYNEEENVREICRAVTAQAERHAASHEIVLIDNCSTDATRTVIRGLCKEDGRIRAIFNNRNYGQMRSPTYGIYQAAGGAVIGMCADFQDPPELIGPFLQQWRAGAQIVLGQRRSERTSWTLGIVRRTGYALLRRFGDHPIIPGATGFGLYDRKVVDALSRWNEPEPFFRAMLVESGFRLAVVPFDRPQRAGGTSSNSVSTLYSFAVSGVASSARSLLRMPIVIAFYGAAAMLLGLVGTVAAMLLGGPVLPLLCVSLAFAMFAMVMLCLGFIGEQIRLLAERSRNVPLVIEEERINFPAGATSPTLRTALER